MHIKQARLWPNDSHTKIERMPNHRFVFGMRSNTATKIYLHIVRANMRQSSLQQLYQQDRYTYIATKCILLGHNAHVILPSDVIVARCAGVP